VILVDPGPIVAVVDDRDDRHRDDVVLPPRSALKIMH